MRILVIRERVTDVRTKTVSYWDTRAAVRALEGLEENGAFAESKLRVKLSWDDGFEKFAETAGQSSTNPQRPQRERDYNRDRGDRDRNRNNNRRGRDRSRSPPRRDRDRNNNRDRDRDYGRNQDSKSDYSSNFKIPPAGKI